jgi:hypothetical protein
MWITTTIHTIEELMKAPPLKRVSHYEKKLELQAKDGDGVSIPPWDNIVQKDEPIQTIKRRWNTLECATEYVNWTNENASWLVSTIEEQV